ncbi:hypothetical protein C3Z09_08255 [Lelliottia aquatilis]|uniref:hypothetical protein n=1 Tax=Lelliottia aquatilis TaxID=2080838 RepID=UPI000CDE9A16|nr:hypothetical protein [Lelliottia aquatilis]POZ17028.1 hypothetical protein C3Z09_08255 [Lelliottia aquatilis]
MKKLTTAAFWIVVTVLFCLMVRWTIGSAQEDCEVRVAKELNTTAVYMNGHCMVKGYGRFDGR